MRFVRTAVIAGVASAAIAGAALAAHDRSQMMLIALPDGSVEHVRYEGATPPQLVLIRDTAPDPFGAAFDPSSAFAEMQRISAAMEAHAAAMMRQAEIVQSAAGADSANPNGIILTGTDGRPVGVMRYSYVSTTTGADGCTRTVRISSDGGSADRAKVFRTSAGNCGAADDAALGDAVKPTNAAPSAEHAPKVTPVSAPRPLPAFTPSRT